MNKCFLPLFLALATAHSFATVSTDPINDTPAPAKAGAGDGQIKPGKQWDAMWLHDAVKGQSTPIPFLQALRALVPVQLNILVKSDVDTSAQVTWGCGTTTTALTEITKQAGALYTLPNTGIFVVSAEKKSPVGLPVNVATAPVKAVVAADSKNAHPAQLAASSNNNRVAVVTPSPSLVVVPSVAKQSMPSVGDKVALMPIQPPMQAPIKADEKANPKAVAAPVATVWVLNAGEMIGRDLRIWGEKSTPKWTVIWSMPKDFTVPSYTTYTGDFQFAANEVIKTLVANGALIHADFYTGNNTMVVSGPGVSAQ